RELLPDRLGNLVTPPPELASEPRTAEEHEHAPRDRTTKARTPPANRAEIRTAPPQDEPPTKPGTEPQRRATRTERDTATRQPTTEPRGHRRPRASPCIYFFCICHTP